jgi:hypothetical protein
MAQPFGTSSIAFSSFVAIFLITIEIPIATYVMRIGGLPTVTSRAWRGSVVAHCACHRQTRFLSRLFPQPAKPCDPRRVEHLSENRLRNGICGLLWIFAARCIKVPSSEIGGHTYVIRRKSSRAIIGARLLHRVDDFFRRKQRGRGDMSRLIREAVEAVDLSSVELIRIHGKRETPTARATQVVIPVEMRRDLERWSEKRAEQCLGCCFA